MIEQRNTHITSQLISLQSSMLISIPDIFICSYTTNIQLSMGNQQNKTSRGVRNKNSFSADFGNDFASKIFPTQADVSNVKFQPVKSFISTPKSKFMDRTFNNPNEKSLQANRSKSNDHQNRLNKLMFTNDQLRKQLIKISSELTTKLQKKRYQPKKTELPDYQKRQALSKELENAYKQVDMYKRNLQQLKNGDGGVRSQTKMVQLQNRIAYVDKQISMIIDNIQSLRNIMENQSTGINRDNNQLAIRQVNSSKKQIEYLKNKIREMGKKSRQKQKKYMQQHQYMFALEDKIKELEDQQAKQKLEELKAIEEKKRMARVQQIEKLEKEAEQLKMKHDEYHKKINTLILGQKVQKETKKNIRVDIQEKNKEIEGLKYKRDALVKQLKDNLDVFANKQEEDEEFSEFQSDDEEQVDPIVEEQDQRGTFDIDHLRDHKIKQKIDAQKSQKKQHKPEKYKQQPKLWQKVTTKMVERGKPKQEEVKFISGIKQPKRDMKIIIMHIWMNKKKQILSLQPIYLVDDQVKEGNKSSNNSEDEYKVSYQLDQFDYLKSMIGIFGKQGFLDFLVLQSNFGKISKIGRSQTIGDNFAIGVAKQETPVQIGGASSFDGTYMRINRLEVEVLLDYTMNQS